MKTQTIHRKFIQALPTDNPAYTPEYAEVLKEAFSHRPDLLDAYLNGNWDAFEDSDQIIKSVWLEMAQSRGAFWPYCKVYIVCDPARYGDDSTVIYLMVNTEIGRKWVMPKTSAPDIVTKIAEISHDNYNCSAVIESVGADLGGAVIDYLIKQGIYTITFNPARKPDRQELGKGVKYKYGNLRAEAWDNAAIVLSKGIIDEEQNCPVVTQNMYDTLRTQLCSVHYKFKNGKLYVEEKDDIKATLGVSPDHADTYIIALWAFPLIDPIDERELDKNVEKNVDFYRDKQHTVQNNPMAF